MLICHSRAKTDFDEEPKRRRIYEDLKNGLLHDHHVPWDAFKAKNEGLPEQEVKRRFNQQVTRLLLG